MEPKRAPKVVFLFLKSRKNIVKFRVSGTKLHPKNKPKNTFRFFVNKNRFSITHGFASVKLMFRSVNGRRFLYF